jgi:hypothetical protein
MVVHRGSVEIIATATLASHGEHLRRRSVAPRPGRCASAAATIDTFRSAWWTLSQGRRTLAANGVVLIVPQTRTMVQRRLPRQLRPLIALALLAIVAIGIVAALADDDLASDLSLLLRTLLSS